MTEPSTLVALVSVIVLQVANIVIAFTSNLKKSDCCGLEMEFRESAGVVHNITTNNYNNSSEVEDDDDS